MNSRRHTLAIAASLCVISIDAASAAVPDGFSLLSDELREHHLTELRVYSSLSLHGGWTLYETVPDEDYVVQHRTFMCRDGITADSAQDLAKAIRDTTFTPEPNKYAVDWVLNFYDARGHQRLSVLAGTGLGDFGKLSDRWHVELNCHSFVAEGPIRDWLSSNYPHLGCTRFDLVAPQSTTHGK